MHELLMRMTEGLPCRVIKVNGAEYLRRYYVGTCPITMRQQWLHHFLREDAERHLHTHPFTAHVTVLCGGYSEEIMDGPDCAPFRNRRYYMAGDYRQILPSTLHRIVSVDPDTWTLLHVEPSRLPYWKFIGDNGNEMVMQSGGEDWWKHYGPRVRQAA